VLLPPGVLHFRGIKETKHGTAHTVYAIDVSYVPDPQFVPKPKRKGAPVGWNAYALPSLF
jgi:hypothetical protein